MTISAIYENGVLRPLTPLQLPERARVQIDVRYPVSQTGMDMYRQRVRELLMSKGLIVSRAPTQHMAGLLSPERRAELARRFAVGRPLSELIIEEREERP